MSRQEISRMEAGLEDDRSVLSPPSIEQPYACATAVVVAGGLSGASIEVEVSGTVVASATVGVALPYGIAVPIPVPLVAGEPVRARQSSLVAVSDWCPPVVVRDHTVDYPAGPPRPEIFQTPLYDCGIRTGVGNLLAGGNVWVTSDGTEIGRRDGCGNPQGVNVSPAFDQGRTVRAWFELCRDPSPPSLAQIVGAPPVPIPAPAISQQYAGGDSLEITGVANGAKVTVRRNGTDLGTWGCWGGSIRLGPFAPAFAAGDILEADQALCPGDPPSGTGSSTVASCSNLPAPGVGPLQAGDVAVAFTSFAAGATLSVWLNGVLVGRGGGPWVALSRAVAYGDTVVVAQDLPGCTGDRALQIDVPCVDPSFASDPASLNLFPVGFADYSSGANRGRAYYPADDDGEDVAFNGRLSALGRVPLVVMAHGNHDPSTSSYLGYEFLQAALARMGIASISIDLNAWNGMGYSISIIEGRADLIIDAIGLMQSRDGDGSWPLAGHIDFGSIGLLGHSQGGEAVVLVPEVLSLAGVTIRAVLALAPTEGGATSRPPADYAFMTLLPASDGDVWPNDGAIFYDRAQPSPFKSQLYVHYTNHQFYNRTWLDDDSTSGNAAPTPPVLSRSAHERVLLAYGCAFYRAALLGHGTTGYLAGTVRPAGAPTESVHLSFERNDPLVVDNHEDGNGIGLNSLGEATQQSGGTVADEFHFGRGGGSFNGSFFGDSVGMVIEAGGNGRMFVQELGGPRDLQGQEVWIRVAEVYAGVSDSAPPTGFRLGVRDANGVEAWIDSDDVGGLPRPFPRLASTMKTMLETRRFKVNCYSLTDKLDTSAVVALMLHCNRRDERALAFDDLHLVAR